MIQLRNEILLNATFFFKLKVQILKIFIIQLVMRSTLIEELGIL